jgi:hypothetical protein
MFMIPLSVLLGDYGALTASSLTTTSDARDLTVLLSIQTSDENNNNVWYE